jgi:DNA-binding XRE family transcriptional regulator
MSQAEAAQVLGIAMQRYHDAEAARLPERDIRAMLAELNNGEQHAPTASELCALARRRTGSTLAAMQAQLQLSKVTFLERERSGDQTILAHWQARGFKFT